MARAKKTETKKTTTKKTPKKVVEDFPVDDIINDLKGTLITENSEQVGCKKKIKTDVEGKPQETNEEVKTFEDELLEKSVNLEGDVETVEAINFDEIVEKNADELKKEIEEEEVVEEPVVENKKETTLKKARKIVTSHKWMGQIIDF